MAILIPVPASIYSLSEVPSATISFCPELATVENKFGLPVKEPNAPSNASVIPYPASVVGFPVSDVNVCAGTDVRYPDPFVS